jgi:hypothetical protein
MDETLKNLTTRMARLLDKAEAILLAETVTVEQRELADSCRETAKELRLVAAFERGIAHRVKKVGKERSERVWDEEDL